MDEPEKAATVPKFGEWDENDPNAADGFTGIFNKVRQEKQTGTANVITLPTASTSRGQVDSGNSKMRCCFL